MDYNSDPLGKIERERDAPYVLLRKVMVGAVIAVGVAGYVGHKFGNISGFDRGYNEGVKEEQETSLKISDVINAYDYSFKSNRDCLTTEFAGSIGKIPVFYRFDGCGLAVDLRTDYTLLPDLQLNFVVDNGRLNKVDTQIVPARGEN